CVRSNVPAPVPTTGCACHDFHASCHQFQRLLEERFVRLFAPCPADLAVGSLNLCSTFDGVIPAASRAPTPTTAARTTARTAARPSLSRHASVTGRRAS